MVRPMPRIASSIRSREGEEEVIPVSGKVSKQLDKCVRLLVQES